MDILAGIWVCGMIFYNARTIDILRARVKKLEIEKEPTK